VIESLVKFYTLYKGQDTDVNRINKKLKSFLGFFNFFPLYYRAARFGLINLRILNPPLTNAISLIDFAGCRKSVLYLTIEF
jgi:hypothetical protein